MIGPHPDARFCPSCGDVYSVTEPEPYSQTSENMLLRGWSYSDVPTETCRGCGGSEELVPPVGEPGF